MLMRFCYRTSRNSVPISPNGKTDLGERLAFFENGYAIEA